MCWREGGESTDLGSGKEHTQLRFHFQAYTPKCRWHGPAWTLQEPGFAGLFFFFFLFPQSLEQLGNGREVRAHTYPSMPACALPSNLTCLLLLNSWKNVKLSSVIKVGFSKGFKNISEFKTLFLLQKINPSSIPLTGASWDLNSLLVFISGYRVGLAFAVLSFAAASRSLWQLSSS